MKKIAYLFGTGATQSEIEHSGWPGKVLMQHVKNHIYTKSENTKGLFFKLIQDLSILPGDIDIEQMISLFEDVEDSKDDYFLKLITEVRNLFFISIHENLLNNEKYLPSSLTSALFRLHQICPDLMGNEGEHLSGVLTVNFDSILENAFISTHGAINYGIQIKYIDYKYSEDIPPILKLHGSFNWKGSDSLAASPDFEKSANDENAKWLRPSVFKKPEGVFRDLWVSAYKILSQCDVLRIVGCSLRIEDWSLISLIFKSQIKSKKFGIELVLPETDSEKIRTTLPFLSKVKAINEIYTELDVKNIFKSFVIKKIDEVLTKQPSINDEPLISGVL